MNTTSTKTKEGRDGYVLFVLEDYVQNPIAIARMEAHLTRKDLAKRMGVTQRYVGKIERQDKVTPLLLERAVNAIRK